MAHSTGTTIVGVTYNGGVVLGADSRTTSGMTVTRWDFDKFTELTDKIYICQSGLVADCQTVSAYAIYMLHQHTSYLGQPATVKAAASLVEQACYDCEKLYQTSAIVGGWDKYEGCQIYSVPFGGTMSKKPFVSGSIYLNAYFDERWKEGMSKEEAEKFVVEAVSLAMGRDTLSGGVVRTVIVNSDGATRNIYPPDKLPLLHGGLVPRNSLLDTLHPINLDFAD